jgi:hypothetical protein
MHWLAILVTGAIASKAIYTIVKYSYLTYQIIKEWFQDNKSLARNPNSVAATIKTSLDSGEYAVVQGVFDESTGSAIKARTIKYDDLDSEMEEIHRLKEVAIYS